MFVYRIKQSRCESLPTVLQMDDGWVADWGAEAESMFGSCFTGGCETEGEKVTVGQEFWEELFGVG